MYSIELFSFEKISIGLFSLRRLLSIEFDKNLMFGLRRLVLSCLALRRLVLGCLSLRRVLLNRICLIRIGLRLFSMRRIVLSCVSFEMISIEVV